MLLVCYFFFNDTATTEIYTLSLHDALPICDRHVHRPDRGAGDRRAGAPRAPRAVHDGVDRVDPDGREAWRPDRKSTRLNSSHANISYAVFCLKKKQQHHHHLTPATYADQPL